ncbi:MAG: hypothetical protein ACL7AX_12825 [Candidatus Arsenophonus phytopathogenicus]
MQEMIKKCDPSYYPLNIVVNRMEDIIVVSKVEASRYGVKYFAAGIFAQKIEQIIQ